MNVYKENSLVVVRCLNIIHIYLLKYIIQSTIF